MALAAAILANDQCRTTAASQPAKQAIQLTIAANSHARDAIVRYDPHSERFDDPA